MPQSRTDTLLIGKNGQVGKSLYSLLDPLGNCLGLGRAELDLTNTASLREIIRLRKPKIIINASAYTNVEGAEEDADSAFAVNHRAVKVIAEEASDLDALFVHFSTDYVFDGQKNNPYLESDIPNPINIYGESKLLGEVAIQEIKSIKSLILRTSWIYSEHGNNFVKKILSLCQSKREISVISDQIGIPTSAKTIAKMTLQAIKEYNLDPSLMPHGIYHLTPSGSTSWYNFAKSLVKMLPTEIYEKFIICEKINPVYSDEYPSKAKRPKNSCLHNAKLVNLLRYNPNQWEVDLMEAMPSIVREVYSA